MFKYISLLVLHLLLLVCLPIQVAAETTPPAITREQLKNRGMLSHDPFFIIGTPKCGSHYITCVASVLLNKWCDEGYDWFEASQFSPNHGARLTAELQVYTNNNIIHKTVVPYISGLEDAYINSGHKWLFITRDPRDAIASLYWHMEWYAHLGDQRDFMWIDSAIYNSLSRDEKISALLTGSCCLSFLQQWYKPMAGWCNSSHGLTIRFEDLVGERGGGTQEQQLSTLRTICDYIRCPVTSEELEAIAYHSYAPWEFQTPDDQRASYPKRGQIGGWKLLFNESQKALFKDLYGDLLIELGYESDLEW